MEKKSFLSTYGIFGFHRWNFFMCNTRQTKTDLPSMEAKKPSKLFKHTQLHGNELPFQIPPYECNYPLKLFKDKLLAVWLRTIGRKNLLLHLSLLKMIDVSKNKTLLFPKDCTFLVPWYWKKWMVLAKILLGTCFLPTAKCYDNNNKKNATANLKQGEWNWCMREIMECCAQKC